MLQCIKEFFKPLRPENRVKKMPLQILPANVNLPIFEQVDDNLQRIGAALGLEDDCSGSNFKFRVKRKVQEWVEQQGKLLSLEEAEDQGLVYSGMGNVCDALDEIEKINRPNIYGPILEAFGRCNWHNGTQMPDGREFIFELETVLRKKSKQK